MSSRFSPKIVHTANLAWCHQICGRALNRRHAENPVPLRPWRLQRASSGSRRLQRAQAAPLMRLHVMLFLFMFMCAPERCVRPGALMACRRVGGHAPTRHLDFIGDLASYRHVGMHTSEKSRPRDVRTHLGPTRAVHAHMALGGVGCPCTNTPPSFHGFSSLV